VSGNGSNWLPGQEIANTDVIDHCLTDPTKEIKEKERSRYVKLCRDFRLTEAAE